MKRKVYDEIDRMKQQLAFEYEDLNYRMQNILNYRNLKVPGNVRVAALDRALRMREFLDEVVKQLEIPGSMDKEE